MRREPVFKSEADLCAAFTAWAKANGVRCYAEWAGWDILLVYPEGWQLGIQAKLRLNAEVIRQALPSEFSDFTAEHGPDFRGVLIPDESPRSDLFTVATALGLIVFHPTWSYKQVGRVFVPTLAPSEAWNGAPKFVDWNPTRREDVPPCETDAIAGSPCPVTLTPWKLRALDVLAELSVNGTITTKRMRELGINPSRWLSGFWLDPSGERGLWVRGERCPMYDQQHPAAYAVALDKARTRLAPTGAGEGAA